MTRPQIDEIKKDNHPILLAYKGLLFPKFKLAPPIMWQPLLNSIHEPLWLERNSKPFELQIDFDNIALVMLLIPC